MRQSLELYRQALGEQHPKVARGLYYVAMAMRSTGAHLETVEPLLRHGIDVMRLTDPGNINLPHMLQQLAAWIITGGKQSRNHGRFPEAESLILEARNLFVRHYGENHGTTLSTDINLASLAIDRGDLERAKNICESNLLRSRQLEEGGQDHIWALFYLGKLNLMQGKRTAAETLFKQATEKGLKKWGAKTSRFEKLGREISLARAGEGT
jgi:tetratricopeptide (TPR) repeat protein